MRPTDKSLPLSPKELKKVAKYMAQVELEAEEVQARTGGIIRLVHENQLESKKTSSRKKGSVQVQGTYNSKVRNVIVSKDPLEDNPLVEQMKQKYFKTMTVAYLGTRSGQTPLYATL